VDFCSFQKGDISRSRSIIGGSFSTIKSISSSVLYTLRLNRIEPCAAVNGTPIARSTWDGSSEPDVQAEPEEAQMPNSSIIRRIDSPSTYSKAMLDVLGSRFLRDPFIKALGIRFNSSFSSLSLNSFTRAMSFPR